MCMGERCSRVCVCVCVSERERERNWMERQRYKESFLMILKRSLVIGIGRGERGVATTERIFNCLRANLSVT